ncbi:MAG TPA: hypothetical protein VEF04_10670, partial [Blastocatellia bacterium]|nr:hypothetical protein [Blastocatellia bacterium]
MKFVCLLLTLLSSFSTLSITVNPVNQVTQAQFIQVNGANLKARLDAAANQARANNQIKRYWTAYQFDVRPGVAVDVEWRNEKGVYIQDGVMMGNGKVETRNLGVFILREVGIDAISRIEIYNLDRRREYSGYPVYWTGRANNEESLNWLKSIADGETTRKLVEQAVTAMALHDDARVSAMLEDFVRQSKVESVR